MSSMRETLNELSKIKDSFSRVCASYTGLQDSESSEIIERKMEILELLEQIEETKDDFRRKVEKDLPTQRETPGRKGEREDSGVFSRASESMLTNEQLAMRPTERQISQISPRIGKEYRVLGLRLGLTQAEMDHIAEDNATSAVARICNVLMKWREKRGKYATFKELEKAFIELGIDVVDAFNGIFDSEDNADA